MHEEECSADVHLAGCVLAVLLSAVLAPVIAPVAKADLDTINSDLARSMRTIVMGASWLHLALPRWTISPAPLPSPCSIGLRPGASWVCCFQALRLGDAAAPVDKLNVMLIAVFAVLCLGEQTLHSPPGLACFCRRRHPAGVPVAWPAADPS